MLAGQAPFHRLKNNGGKGLVLRPQVGRDKRQLGVLLAV